MRSLRVTCAKARPRAIMSASLSKRSTRKKRKSTRSNLQDYSLDSPFIKKSGPVQVVGFLKLPAGALGSFLSPCSHFSFSTLRGVIS